MKLGWRSLSLAFAILCLSQVTFAEEPQKLLNGKDLEGWDGDPAVWSFEEGAVVGQTKADAPIAHNTFLIWKGGKVDNFRLEFDYKIEGGNSGVQYRSTVVDPKEWVVGGYQADIDSGPTYSGILYEEKERGILAKRGEKMRIDKEGKSQTESFANTDDLQKAIHTDDWNHYVIEAKGNKLQHTINGKLMSETIDKDRKNKSKSGVLALQVHAGPPMKVQFRDIKLTPIARAKKGGKSEAKSDKSE